MAASSQVTRLVLNGITKMEKMLGNPTFIWNGETFDCVPNSLNDEIKSDYKFFTEDGEFRMTVRLNQFSSNIYPDKNNDIFYMNVRLLVKKIIKPAHGVYWVYVCQLPKING
jgi:hypothetical protein